MQGIYGRLKAKNNFRKKMETSKKMSLLQSSALTLWDDLCDRRRLERHDFFVKKFFELFSANVVLVHCQDS